MAAVVNCSRRLLLRPSTARAAAFALPSRQRPSSLPLALTAVLAPAQAPLATAGSASIPSAAPSHSSHPFSTSAAAAAKKASMAQHVRRGRSTQTSRKKKKAFTRPKAPAPGERKAFRKRIVLSNNNALAVPGLEEMAAGDLAAASNQGRILALPDAVVDQLRASEAFKPTQTFSLFRQPSLLVRAETVALAQRLQQDVAAEHKTLRIVVDGPRIAGKSVLLLQAMAHGFLNDWLVISIPEAQELTSACTEYSVLPGTEPPQYAQPNYTFRLLQAIRAANAPVLARYTTARAHDQLTNPVPAGSTLDQLLAAAKEPDGAWPVFQALWSELTSPPDAATERPPLLFALDGLAHAMRVSGYRAPSFAPIHAHDLALVRVFADALGGATAFPHGAAVLAATTRGNTPANATVDLALEQRQQEASGAEAVSTAEPYFRGYDERVAAALRTVEVLALRGVSKTEARALLEYWAASGVLRERVDEQAVTAAWMLGGSGVVGEMERAALLSLRP